MLTLKGIIDTPLLVKKSNKSCSRKQRFKHIIIEHDNTRGTLAYEIKQGAINTNILLDFLVRYLEKSVEESPQPILIMENARFHHSQRVREICNEKGVVIEYLQDYSPQLNPIEEYFSIVKA
ncbi:hypothetical protein DMUE_3736 [Dictyocoela muelleri]|nr:hypothetical protein DMUE_3736 [Dictyocoela muelleri]